MAKKAVSIELLLHWAYREELPKKESGGGVFMDHDYFLLGTRVDETRRSDFEPGFVGVGAPHPDALMLDWLVRQLPGVTVEWEHQVDRIMGSLAPYAPPDDLTVRRMQFSRTAIVMACARMATRPQWDLGQLKLKRIIGKNGKPVVEGITAGRRYVEGAHCPLQLEPPAREIAAARTEYVLWHESLTALAGESWKLEEHVARAPSAAEMPWFSDKAKPRILSDLTTSKEAFTTLRR